MTLALTVVLAVALGGIIWLSVTSIPYLATSPTTDPEFGALNACLLTAVPERVGFAVSRDGTRAAAWSTSTLAQCDGAPPVATTHAFTGGTIGTFDGERRLWLAQDSADAGGARLVMWNGTELVERGSFAPAALAGTAKGVVAMDPAGQLVAISGDGTVTATRALPGQRQVQLVSDATGRMVALFGGGKFAVVDATTLDSTAAEAPCPVRWAWWRPDSPLVLVDCVDITVELNAIDSRSMLVDARQRIRSTLLGPGGRYVQACDVLPCSATPPP